MLLIATIVLISIFYWYVCIVKPMRYWKDRGVEQGKPLWVFGHYWQNLIGIRNGAETFLEIYKQASNLRYTGFYRFSTPTLVVKDPELIKKITVTDFDAFTDRPVLVAAESDPLWTNNLCNLTGSKWKNTRSCISSSLVDDQISDLFPQMVDCAKNLLTHLSKNDQEIAALEIKDIFSRYSNDVLATTVFGVKVNSLANPNNEFYRLGNKVSDVSTLWKTLGLKIIWFLPVIVKFVKIHVICKEAAAYFRKIVDTNVKSKKEKDSVPPNILHSFMEAMKNCQAQNVLGNKAESNGLDKVGCPKALLDLSNEDITTHAVFFLFIGLEPVACSMSFTIYELALNPEVQEKLRLEIFSTFKNCEGQLTYEAILNMKYMHMVVSESLRKWPHFTILVRTCTKPYTITPVLPHEKLVHIEEGTEIKIPLYAIHHDPKYYPDPERFDPERFSDENKRSIHPYTYFPFSLGPRDCIGDKFSLVEMKVMLFHLLSNFVIVPVEKTAIPLKFHKTTIVNLKPVGGIWIGFKRYKK